MKRSSTTMQVACLVCHNDMDDRTGVRSGSWFRGVIGTRAILCSPECAKAFDAENLSYMRAIMNDEEVVA